MTDEQALREKLRKIEALFAGAGTAGERAAAGAAAGRIRARLGTATGKEVIEEFRFSILDLWSRQLFIALCRRYGVDPFRYRRMHRQTVIVKAPRSFVEQILWPEFQDLSAALSAYIAEITEKVIREEIHGQTGDAEERDEPKPWADNCGAAAFPTEAQIRLARRPRLPWNIRTGRRERWCWLSPAARPGWSISAAQC